MTPHSNCDQIESITRMESDIENLKGNMAGHHRALFGNSHKGIKERIDTMEAWMKSHQAMWKMVVAALLCSFGSLVVGVVLLILTLAINSGRERLDHEKITGSSNTRGVSDVRLRANEIKADGDVFSSVASGTRPGS